jgi:hypothetical protein
MSKRAGAHLRAFYIIPHQQQPPVAKGGGDIYRKKSIIHIYYYISFAFLCAVLQLKYLKKLKRKIRRRRRIFG